MKKRSRAKANATFEDAFSNDVNSEDDMVSSSLRRESRPTTTTTTTKISVPADKRSKAPAELFEEQFNYVSARIGQHPAVTHPQVRENALRRLLHHSQEASHLERLGSLFIAWRNGGRTVDKDTTLEFIGAPGISRACISALQN